MTEWTDFLLPSQTEAPTKRDPSSDPGYVHGVEYDQYKRYMLPEPGGDPSELVPWTRVTTLAGCVTNQDGLRIWTEREMCRGIGMRVDLRNLLASDPDDVAVIDEVRDTAKMVAGIGASASSGRALHRVVEARTDPHRAQDFAPIDPSDQFGRDCLAALQCLRENGIRVRMVEVLVIHATLGYAGRLDALWEVDLPDGRTVIRIGDVKTGDKLDKPEKRHSMGCQLGGYANATHAYDPNTRTFRPLSDFGIDHTAGYILSVRDGVAQLHEIDLLAGWARMLTAVKVHRDRAASVDMLPVGRPVRIEDPAVTKMRAELADTYAVGAPDPYAGWIDTSPVPQQPPMPSPRQPSADRAVCPGDPSHYADSHSPGGAWSGVPLDHGQATDQASPLRVIADAFAAVGSAVTAPAEAAEIQREDHLADLAPIPTVPAIAVGVPAPGFDATSSLNPPDPEVERSPSGRKRRACSKCRKHGHTAKKCPGGEQAAPGGVDPQGVGKAVDPEQHFAPELRRTPEVCPHASGWTCRQSDGAWVCASCGQPSEATVAAMRSGDPLPTVTAPLAPVLENGATVARLDPAPGQAPAPAGTPVLESPLENSTEPVALPAAQVPVLGVAVDAPAPWLQQQPAAPADPREVRPGESVDAWLHRQIIEVIGSQEELGQLWQAHGKAWTQAHTDAAGQRVAQGLPTFPSA